MRTIIAGSRNIVNYGLVARAIELLPFRITVVISGGANGVDSSGEYWAAANNIPCERYPADWETYGKRAGYIRNAHMERLADAALAVWDGKSRGTSMMIDLMVKARKPVYVWRTDV